MLIQANIMINCRDLKNTIQWSLLESPMNINKIAIIIIHIAEEVKIFEIDCKIIVVLSYNIYFGILELI